MVRDEVDIRARLQAALRKWQAVQERQQACDQLAAAAGDVYVFPATAAAGIEWVCVLPHVDDDQLWFMIPLDQHPLAGTWDIAVPESSDAGPGTLRCGRGIWVHAADLTGVVRSGFLESAYVNAARQRIAAMVSDSEEVQSVRAEVDDDPDYEDWLAEVTAAAEALEMLLRAETPAVIRVSQFTSDWQSAPPLRTAARSAHLTADPAGLSAAPEEPLPALPGMVLAAEVPGVLAAVQYDNGLRFLYFPAAGEVPPLLEVRDADGWRLMSWRVLPDGVHETTADVSGAETDVRWPGGSRRIVG